MTRTEALEAVAKAARPFAIAADDLNDETQDRSEIWEMPAAMSITAGDLRRVKAWLAALDGTPPDDGSRRSPVYGFDAGNGVFKEGYKCIVHGHTDLGVGEISAIYQDGDAQVSWSITRNVKWRYILPVPRDGGGS